MEITFLIVFGILIFYAYKSYKDATKYPDDFEE